ncbi:hypothetical protein BS78_07G005100 [Paspalum vaginatum]|nr:hypothetical protein BS78_07G005100 [Paspalum vaginatum]
MTLSAVCSVLLLLLALALLVSWIKAGCNKKGRQGDEAMHRRRRLLPPGPAGLPVIGSIHHMLWREKPVFFRWIHGLLKEMDTNILCLRFGAVHVVVVDSPEIAHEVLRNKDAAFASRPITLASGSFSFGYKGSILSPYGEQWKKMRRVLTRDILSTSMERRLQRRRQEEADHLLRLVIYSQQQQAGGLVNVRHVAQHFCGNMIRTLVFGKRHFAAAGAAAPGPEEEKHVAALFTLLNYLYSFSVSDYIPAGPAAWIVDLDGHGKVAKGVMKTLNRLHDPIIKERIREWSSLRKSGGKRASSRDFLDVLVSLLDSEGQPFLTLDEIRAQTLLLVIVIRR